MLDAGALAADRWGAWWHEVLGILSDMRLRRLEPSCSLTLQPSALAGRPLGGTQLWLRFRQAAAPLGGPRYLLLCSHQRLRGGGAWWHEVLVAVRPPRGK